VTGQGAGGSELRYRVNYPQVINETIDGEAIMINLATGNYYSLDRVGGEVWALVEASLPLDDLVAELGRRYAAPDHVIRQGVDDLLDRLSREELVVPGAEDEPVLAAPLEPPPAVRAPYKAPTLQKFTDMQDLILLDPVHEVDSRGWPHPPDEQHAGR
jgi:Coenzyme PQQ synthesis protein D (PqqD)